MKNLEELLLSQFAVAEPGTPILNFLGAMADPKTATGAVLTEQALHGMLWDMDHGRHVRYGEGGVVIECVECGSVRP